MSDTKVQECVEAFRPLAETAQAILKKKVDDGGPAFPPPWHPEMGWSPRDAQGMSLRDYFAAHAPPMPDWFNVAWEPGPDRPEIIDRSPFLQIPRLREAVYAWRKAWHVPASPPHKLTAIGETDQERAWLEEYEKWWDQYFDACEERRNRHERDRYFAWRFRYADQMLRARAE